MCSGVEFAREPELADVEGVGKKHREPAQGDGVAVTCSHAPSGDKIPQLSHGVFAGRIGLKHAADKRGCGLVYDDGPQLRFIQITHRGLVGVLAPAQLLPDAALYVLGQIVHVVFRLPKGNVQHELALGRVLKPERGELQSQELAGVHGIDDPATVNRVAGQSVGMPGQNPLSLAALKVRHHLVENLPAGRLGRHGFDELADDVQAFFLGELPQFGQLRLDGQHLPVVFVGRFAGIDKHSHVTHDISYVYWESTVICVTIYIMKRTYNEKKTEFLSVRLSRNTKTALQSLADNDARSVSWIVSKILEDYVQSIGRLGVRRQNSGRERAKKGNRDV